MTTPDDRQTWPNPPASQQPARPATLAASEASRVLGEGSNAQEARVAAYAEAMGLAPRYASSRAKAARVVAVADAEQADLRAEVERLADEVKARINIGRLVKGAFDETWDERDAALAEVTELRDRLADSEEEVRRQYHEAQVAEARLAKVEALRRDLEPTGSKRKEQTHG